MRRLYFAASVGLLLSQLSAGVAVAMIPQGHGAIPSVRVPPAHGTTLRPPRQAPATMVPPRPGTIFHPSKRRALIMTPPRPGFSHHAPAFSQGHPNVSTWPMPAGRAVIVARSGRAIARSSAKTSAANAPCDGYSACYGPGNASYAAYYANPSNQSAWSAFCSGAGYGASYTGVQALGVPACGPTDENVGVEIGANGATCSASACTGGPTPGFQCVEFAERYLYVTYGYAAIDSTNGDQVVANYASAHSLNIVGNGTGQLPQVGAVMSFADNSSFNSPDGGHVAVVTAVNSTSVTVVGENQNGSGPLTDGSETMTVTDNDYINSFISGESSIEWFNPPSGGGHVFRVTSTGTSYYIDSSGFAHWIPNGGVYLCLTAWDGASVVQGTQAQAETFPRGTNESCEVTQAFNTIVREANGTSFYVDGSGVAHWIPNGGTFSCLYYWDGVAMYSPVTVQQADTFARGSNESCEVTQAFNTVIRQSNGTSYYVDDSGVAHWIQNGATYDCLVYGEGLPLYNNLSQQQIDTFAQGSWEPDLNC
jgi:hypothetical protein